MKLNNYLFFNGDCHEAVSHYVDVLGGEILQTMRNSDAPSEEDRMPGGDDMIMNMVVRLGESLVMASDNSEDMYREPAGFYLQLDFDDEAEFDRVHAALSADAKRVDMPAGETFWAKKFAMFQDRHGTPWMLNYDG